MEPVEPLGYDDEPEDPDKSDTQWVEAPRRAGQLTPVWRLVFGVGWAAVIVGLVAVWESSRVIGLSTWWLGADAEPCNLLLNLLPFYAPLLVMYAAISNWRFAPYFGVATAAIGAAIGAGDLGRVRWIAVVELVLAGAALCISVASLAGMYRLVAPPDPVS
ncbi:MAG: hypothetical protein ABI706_03305 [Ilumatobacteraceae bacterium]